MSDEGDEEKKPAAKASTTAASDTTAVNDPGNTFSQFLRKVIIVEIYITIACLLLSGRHCLFCHPFGFLK